MVTFQISYKVYRSLLKVYIVHTYVIYMKSVYLTWQHFKYTIRFTGTLKIYIVHTHVIYMKSVYLTWQHIKYTKRFIGRS